MGWQHKQIHCRGVILFKGETPPALEQMDHLARAGMRIESEVAPQGAAWAARVEHPQWGSAHLVCPRRGGGLSRPMVDQDPTLTPPEREELLAGRSNLVIKMASNESHLLRDRKRFLRLAWAILGRMGVGAVDGLSQRLWPRAALVEELSHSADPDIEALFSTHVIPDSNQRCSWLHTHGLFEIGQCDLDVLQPAPPLMATHWDLVRALVFGLLEGQAETGRIIRLGYGRLPGEELAVQLVDIEQFHAKAAPELWALRSDDDGHRGRRVVACQPIQGWRRWTGQGMLAPAKCLSEAIGPQPAALFSPAAAEMISRRAKATYGLFRRLTEELGELGTPMVKLGYKADNPADGNDREHLWFEAHQLLDEHIDATLAGHPTRLAQLRHGQRGVHGISHLSDWSILTPLGPVTPRNTVYARTLRQVPELREQLRTHAAPRLAG